MLSAPNEVVNLTSDQVIGTCIREKIAYANELHAGFDFVFEY